MMVMALLMGGVGSHALAQQVAVVPISAGGQQVQEQGTGTTTGEADEGNSAIDHRCQVFDMKGNVNLLRKDNEVWQPLRVGDVIIEGDQVKTGKDAYVDIVLDQLYANRMRIEANTVAEFRGIEPTKIHIIRGTVFSDVQGMAEGSYYYVATDTGVASVQGTAFVRQYRYNIDSTFVLEGTVKVTRPSPNGQVDWSQSVAVKQNQMLDLSAHDVTSVLSAGIQMMDATQLEAVQTSAIDHRDNFRAYERRTKGESGGAGPVKKSAPIVPLPGNYAEFDQRAFEEKEALEKQKQKLEELQELLDEHGITADDFRGAQELIKQLEEQGVDFQEFQAMRSKLKQEGLKLEGIRRAQERLEESGLEVDEVQEIQEKLTKAGVDLEEVRKALKEEGDGAKILKQLAKNQGVDAEKLIKLVTVIEKLEADIKTTDGQSASAVKTLAKLTGESGKADAASLNKMLNVVKTVNADAAVNKTMDILSSVSKDEGMKIIQALKTGAGPTVDIKEAIQSLDSQIKAVGTSQPSTAAVSAVELADEDELAQITELLEKKMTINEDSFATESGMAGCGNGVVEAPEECDGGEGCTAACAIQVDALVEDTTARADSEASGKTIIEDEGTEGDDAGGTLGQAAIMNNAVIDG
ncbi:MAG: FecR domain-containing protein [Candidatus Omnitrophota bacterium]|nr:FecR domain-containing protein [Candidatus Omnitrophota bacterium]